MGYSINGLRLDDAINAKFLGVIADGINDDTNSLNALFHNYRKIYLPAGTYLISKTLVIPDNTTVIGDGESTVIQLADTYSLTNYSWRDTYKYPLIRVGANCILQDFLVNGDETKAKDQGQVGVWISGDNTICHNVDTKNINYFPESWIGDGKGYGTINAPGYGIFVHDCKNVIVDSCSTIGNGYEGIGIESAENIIIKNCFVGNGNRTGIQVHRYSDNVIIDSCTVDNQNSYKHADLTIHGDGERITAVKIIGCSFLHAGEEKASIQTVTGLETGVIVDSCYFNSQNLAASFCHDNPNDNMSRKIIFTNNIIASAGGGISVHGDNVIITNNMIDCVSTPVSVSGTHSVIENNLTIVAS